MCRTRRDTLVSHPSTPIRHHSTNNLFSTSTAISTTSTSTSSFSSSTTLSALRLSLSDNPTLYPFSEISNSIRSKTPPWRSTLRGKQVLISHLPFNGDPSTLPSRLSILSKSHHTSLLPLLGASLTADSLYLIHESPPFATLRDCLRNPKNPDFTPLSTWISRIQIAADIADGLQYIHVHCNTIHNRLTSSAILVTDPALRAKICHFGATDLAGEDRGTKIEGTRGYIAPEVISGGRISQKSDVFAFGVVILEIVSGREPVRYRMKGGDGEGYEREAVVEAAREAIGMEDEDGASVEETEERRWRVRRWVDRRLRDSFPVEVAERLIRVALRCVEEERFMRPEMTWVAGIVSGLLLESRVWDETVRLPTDFSVTVAPR